MNSSQDSNESSKEPESPNLVAAIEKYQLSIPPEFLAPIDEYCQQLWDINQTMNLTRHTTYDRFVSRDLMDTVELAAFIEQGEQVLDIGSGGGVPGLVLSILRPDVIVTVCDSVSKKAHALATIAEAMQLPVTVAHTRAELLLETYRFDTLTARAVGSMSKMLRWFQPHWDAFNRLLLIKGPRWVEERGEARHLGLLNELQLRKLREYPMPGTDSKSVILSILDI